MSSYHHGDEPGTPPPLFGVAPIRNPDVSPAPPIAMTGAVPTPAQAPGLGQIPSHAGLSGAGGVEVLVHQLVDAQYRGRRVRFGQITGTVQGVAQTLGLALRPDGSTTARATEQKLHLVDDRGHDHYLEFTATDRARILD